MAFNSVIINDYKNILNRELNSIICTLDGEIPIPSPPDTTLDSVFENAGEVVFIDEKAYLFDYDYEDNDKRSYFRLKYSLYKTDEKDLIKLIATKFGEAELLCFINSVFNEYVKHRFSDSKDITNITSVKCIRKENSSTEKFKRHYLFFDNSGDIFSITINTDTFVIDVTKFKEPKCLGDIKFIENTPINTEHKVVYDDCGTYKSGMLGNFFGSTYYITQIFEKRISGAFEKDEIYHKFDIANNFSFTEYAINDISVISDRLTYPSVKISVNPLRHDRIVDCNIEYQAIFVDLF